ncbi:hypothetical protein SAMD00023353_6000620 [Rosellinia necatrix]|uniref:Uncharacterized protein n=1 Tax=Rosellinia necatrix TaxID=77044 RepID=A0A1W2TS33_ROSNE|nr:hypothetical protein SAMD00023353_6000620 [Rosellinia necatrix]
MSHKLPGKSRPPHHRHSHPPGPTRPSRLDRGRSRSRPSLKAGASSAELHSRSIPPPSLRSRSRPRTHQRVNARDIPIYIPSCAPKLFAEAAQEQGQTNDDALTASKPGYQPPTPPPESTLQRISRTSRHSTSGVKRRPSASPAAAKTRRRRRRRPRPQQQQSLTSMQDEPIPPPQPEFGPFYPPRPASPAYSFFGFTRTKAEKERREEDAYGKREREEGRRKKRKEAECGRRRRDDGCGRRRDGYDYGQDDANNTSKRTSSVPPPHHTPFDESQAYAYGGAAGDEFDAGSRAEHHQRHKHGKHRRKKHHRRSGEQQHRRQKRRSKYRMRDFFASLRRKLGNLLRLTPPQPASPPLSALPYTDTSGGNWADPHAAANTTTANQQYRTSQSTGEYEQAAHPRWDREQRRSRQQQQQQQQYQQQQQQVPPPYYVYGGEPRYARGGKRRFSVTVESPAGGSKRSSRAGGRRAAPPSPHGSESTISIIARRFMGPFLSEAGDEVGDYYDDNAWPGSSSWKLGWRSPKLLTAGGSRPATPPLSREPSPEGCLGCSEQGLYTTTATTPGGGYHHHHHRTSSVSSFGLRDLYGSSPLPSPSSPTPVSAPAPAPDAGLVRTASPYRLVSATPEYGGLADLFGATPVSTGSPVYYSSTVRVLPLADEYGGDLPPTRFYAASPSPSSTSNFGLRRLFTD